MKPVHRNNKPVKQRSSDEGDLGIVRNIRGERVRSKGYALTNKTQIEFYFNKTLTSQRACKKIRSESRLKNSIRAKKTSGKKLKL
jgi:hypothetical protein